MPSKPGSPQKTASRSASSSHGKNATKATARSANTTGATRGSGRKPRKSILKRLGVGRSDDAPPSNAAEQDEKDNAAPASGTRLSAAEIHENVRVAADEEMRRPAADLIWSSIAGGLTIGFSFLAAGYLTLWVDPRLAPVAIAVGYPLGFIFVVQARSQLFTENTLEPVIPFLQRRDRETFTRLLRLWVLVLAGNLLGALVFGALASTTMLDTEMHRALLRVATAGTDGGFAPVLYRAIFGGWLVALMAWLVSSTRASGAQIVYIWITTAPIAAFDFRHSVAGAVEAFYLAIAGASPWSSMLGGFLVPAIIGNVIGGVVLVAMLNHGQVGTDGDGGTDDPGD